MQTIDRPNVGETNGLVNGQSYHQSRHKNGAPREVYWTEPGLRITRFRMLSDYGFPMWDISYCHGMIGDEPVEVELPFYQLPKRGWKKAIVNYAKKDGVFARGIGIFENASTLC